MSDPSLITDRPLDGPIHTIYFYYLQYPRDGNQQTRPTITVYYQFDETTPIRDEADLRRLIESLTMNARAADFVPPPCGYSFSAVPWRKKSYFVVLLDDPELKFSNEYAVNIDFEERLEEFNHSFFNARKLDIDLPRGEKITAFCCVNLMQHKEGGDLIDGQSERYRVVLTPVDNQVRRYGKDGDDGGTNQGGPIPPMIAD
jgi:hypothetical protein